MKAILISLLFMSFISVCDAQIAVSGRYLSNSATILGGVSGGEIDVTAGGYELGVGYWFRLQNKRLEFTPEISYGASSFDQFDITTIGFNWNALIYPLDFHSDCNACPTFSKEGGLIKKGFYWLVSPGLIFANSDFGANLDTESKLTYRIGVGAGLDIGVTNLLTVSPFAMYNITGSAIEFQDESSGINQVHLGVRFTLRYDKDRW